MLLKKINLVINTLIVLVLLLTLLVLIKALFSDNKGFEWGSVTDWISAICNIAMAGAAIFAAYNAPKWLRQKQNESGYNYAISIMAEYDEIVANLKDLHSDILITKQSNPNFESLANEVSKQVYKVIALQSKLFSCNRWGVTYKEPLQVSINTILQYYDKSFGLIHFRGNEDYIKVNSRINEVTNLLNAITISSVKLNIELNKIFTFSN